MLRSSWEIAQDPSFQSSASIWDAQRTMNRAFEKEGSLPARIARARGVLEDMERIAENVPDPADKPVIHRMTHQVVELLHKLEQDLQEQ
jgi:hypothetical protein